VGYSHVYGRQHFVTRIQFIDSVTVVVTTINKTIKLTWKRNNYINPYSVRVRVTLQLTVSQSVSLGVEPNLGLLTIDFFF
jgi:hypothetical protein